MPSQASAKHTDTSHAQNRRSPHLCPLWGVSGAHLCWGTPPPTPNHPSPTPSPCLVPARAAGWHPCRRALNGIPWSSVPVSRHIVKQRSEVSCSKPIITATSHRKEQSWPLDWGKHGPCSWHTGLALPTIALRRKRRTHTGTYCTSTHTHTHTHRDCPEEARDLQSVRNVCSLLIRVRTHRLV